MDKDNLVYNHTPEYQLASNTEGNSAVCDKFDEPWGHCDKKNKHNDGNAYIAWFRLYKVCKVVKFTESKSGMVVARDWGEGGMESY